MANVDRRRGNSDKFPVARYELDTITVGAAVTTEVTDTIAINGIIGTLCMSLNNTTNNVTATISVRDEDSFVLYSSSGNADNTLHVKTDVDILSAGVLTIGITPSGAPGASTLTADIVLYVV